MESKAAIYNQLPLTTYPRTILATPGISIPELVQKIAAAGLEYPLIAKPDYGERGLGVQKINNLTELVTYVRKMPVAFLVQEFIAWKEEVGIFYCRIPDESTGRITGIVHKQPVVVIGDGQSTIQELILRVPRYILQWRELQRTLGDEVNKVLPHGVEQMLIPYGNHSRGSRFTDISHMNTKALEQKIDLICQSIPGFYFGRLDIRYDSWDELINSDDFSIIELNGSGSEPTHIYDPQHSLFFAWKEIIRHWQLMFRVSMVNKKRGTSYLSFRKGREAIKAFRKIEMQLQAHNW